MSEKYKLHNPEGCYFITITVVDWIDLFTRKELKYIIINSLKHCQKEKGLVINAWCVMSSHLHLIVRSETGKLSDILRDFKKFTSKEIVKTIESINESRREWLLESFANAGRDLKRITNFKVWQDGNHPEEL
jgi:putative transposase